MGRELPASLLMFIASRSAANRVFEALQERGFDDVTIAQSRLMMGIDPDGTRVLTLANDHTARIWKVLPGNLRPLIRDAVTPARLRAETSACLTVDQRKTLLGQLDKVASEAHASCESRNNRTYRIYEKTI